MLTVCDCIDKNVSGFDILINKYFFAVCYSLFKRGYKAGLSVVDFIADRKKAQL